MRNKNSLEQKVADVVSIFLDNLKKGYASPIEEVLEEYPELSEVLRPKLETVERFYQDFIMEKAPEDLKKELYSKLLAEMDRLDLHETSKSTFLDEPIINRKMISLGDSIISYRRQKGLSLIDFANQLNEQKELLSKIENNCLKNIPESIFTKLSEILKEKVVSLKKLASTSISPVPYLNHAFYRTRDTIRETVMVKNKTFWLDDIIQTANNVIEQYFKNKVIEIPIPVEKIGDLQFGLKLLYTKELPDDKSGACLSEEKMIQINEYETLEERRRFTYAHEMGHFILHITEKTMFRCIKKDIGFKKDQIKYSPNNKGKQMESEANVFAAEILMPSKIVKKMFLEESKDISFLSKKFKVSKEAMEWKLTNIRLITGKSDQQILDLFK